MLMSTCCVCGPNSNPKKNGPSVLHTSARFDCEQPYLAVRTFFCVGNVYELHCQVTVFLTVVV